MTKKKQELREFLLLAVRLQKSNLLTSSDFSSEEHQVIVRMKKSYNHLEKIQDFDPDGLEELLALLMSGDHLPVYCHREHGIIRVYLDDIYVFSFLPHGDATPSYYLAGILVQFCKILGMHQASRATIQELILEQVAAGGK